MASKNRRNAAERTVLTLDPVTTAVISSRYTELRNLNRTNSSPLLSLPDQLDYQLGKLLAFSRLSRALAEIDPLVESAAENRTPPCDSKLHLWFEGSLNETNIRWLTSNPAHTTRGTTPAFNHGYDEGLQWILDMLCLPDHLTGTR